MRILADVAAALRGSELGEVVLDRLQPGIELLDVLIPAEYLLVPALGELAEEALVGHFLQAKNICHPQPPISFHRGGKVP